MVARDNQERQLHVGRRAKRPVPITCQSRDNDKLCPVL